MCNELKACRTREERAQQNASRDSWLSHFLSYAANFSEKFALRGLEETIKHVSYFSLREANCTSFAAIVRIWLSPIHRSSNVTLERRVQDGSRDGKGVNAVIIVVCHSQTKLLNLDGWNDANTLCSRGTSG